MNLQEASLTELYTSAILAFPRTTMRQHATHPIVIAEIRWTPFLGAKTLFTKGLAQSDGKEYNPIILFKNVNYNGDQVHLTASDGLDYMFNPLSLESTNVSIRCNCPDFKWRFNYYNSLQEKSLSGRARGKYESSGGPPANPLELPGMCKHIIKFVEVLNQSGIFG